MPTYHEWVERRDLDKLYELAATKLIWIHRPLLVHTRSTSGQKCTCCNSRLAEISEEHDHIDVLINPITGTRKVRSKVQDKAGFDALTKKAKRINIPRRVSTRQQEAMRCRAKILLVLGGVRGGKTSYLADEVLDESLENGGPGVQVWWLAPTLEKTEIALRKLVHGEVVGKGKYKRTVDPLLPDALIKYVPTSPKADRKYVELVDGTHICLKYGSRKGGNLKGDPPVMVGMDEGCEIDNIENYHQCLDRLMEADGRLVISTTPVAGHYLKSEVYDPGVEVSEWDGEKRHAWMHITAFENPWVKKENIEASIASLNDPQRVRREIMGEWVGSGPVLWAEFDEDKHIVDFDGYRVEDWGLVNVTSIALRGFFRGKKCHHFAGMDFDISPMSFAAVQVACPPGLDPKNSDNWIFVQYDEVVQDKHTIHSFIDELDKRGFNGTQVACDPSGAQFNPYRLRHGVAFNSTHAKELTRRGYPTKACHFGAGGKPYAPPVLDRINTAHKLMREETAPDENGKKWPRYLIHRRCERTIDSHRTQEAREDGTPVKETGTESDKISGPTDAETYAMWIPFKGEYQTKTVWRH